MTLLSTVKSTWQVHGARGTALAIADRVIRAKASVADQAADLVRGSCGLEVGGTSRIFSSSGLLPVYDAFASLDNVNYASRTLWERELADEGSYAPQGRRLGTQYLREAINLQGLPDEHYDALLSSHVLEHVANPLAALREWRRVCRPEGHLLLVLPHRDGTFDHRRPLTTLEHLRNDEGNAVGEDDRTHIEEMLQLHDLRRDPGHRTKEDLRRDLVGNAESRAVHHHVFDSRLALAALVETGWSPLAAVARRPHHIIVLARRAQVPSQLDITGCLTGSPFPSDRELLQAR